MINRSEQQERVAKKTPNGYRLAKEREAEAEAKAAKIAEAAAAVHRGMSEPAVMDGNGSSVRIVLNGTDDPANAIVARVTWPTSEQLTAARQELNEALGALRREERRLKRLEMNGVQG